MMFESEALLLDIVVNMCIGMLANINLEVQYMRLYVVYQGDQPISMLNN